MALSRFTGGLFPGLRSAPGSHPASDQPDSDARDPGRRSSSARRSSDWCWGSRFRSAGASTGSASSSSAWLRSCLRSHRAPDRGARRPVPRRSLSFSERLAAVNVYGVAAHRARAVCRLRGDPDARPRHRKRLRVPVVSAVAGAAAHGRASSRLPSSAPVAPRTATPFTRASVLLLVPAPVLLFLVLARLPGELGPIDFFHEGELLAAAAADSRRRVPLARPDVHSRPSPRRARPRWSASRSSRTRAGGGRGRARARLSLPTGSASTSCPSTSSGETCSSCSAPSSPSCWD